MKSTRPLGVEDHEPETVAVNTTASPSPIVGADAASVSVLARSFHPPVPTACTRTGE